MLLAFSRKVGISRVVKALQKRQKYNMSQTRPVRASVQSMWSITTQISSHFCLKKILGSDLLWVLSSEGWLARYSSTWLPWQLTALSTRAESCTISEPFQTEHHHRVPTGHALWRSCMPQILTDRAWTEVCLNTACREGVWPTPVTTACRLPSG